MDSPHRAGCSCGSPVSLRDDRSEFGDVFIMRAASHARARLAAVLMNFLRLSRCRLPWTALRSTSAAARSPDGRIEADVTLPRQRAGSRCRRRSRQSRRDCRRDGIASGVARREPHDRRLGVAPGRARRRHVGAPANRDPRLRSGDAHVELLLSPSGWHVHDRRPQHWIALLAFLVVAVVASNLSAAAQDRAREAIARRNEVTRLFDLTRDVLLSTDTANAIETLASDMWHVALTCPGWPSACLPITAGRFTRAGSSRSPSTSTCWTPRWRRPVTRRRSTARWRRPDLPGSTVSIVPLRHGTQRGRPPRGGLADTRYRRPRRRRGRRRHCDRTSPIPGGT